MEQRTVEMEAQPKKEPFFTKSVLIIIAAFVVIDLVFVTFLFMSKNSGGKEKGEAAQAAGAKPMDEIALIDFGDPVEMVIPMDPMGRGIVHVKVSIELQVSALRSSEIEERIKKFEPMFKEQARKAFRDADPRDVANENVAGIKNTIRTGINTMLGEEAVKDVIFGEYKAY